MWDRIIVRLLCPSMADHACASVTPAFYGAGMLSGLNASWSFCKVMLALPEYDSNAASFAVGGSILAWGISKSCYLFC